jgi:hypothetical protein
MPPALVSGGKHRGRPQCLPPAFIATPKFGGFPRAPTPRWRFTTRSFEISSELHEGAPKRTTAPKTSRGRPPTNEVLFGGSDAAQQVKHRGLPRCLTLETRTGGMFRVLHDPQRSSPPRNANLETEREFPPYHAKQVMGGLKRAVTPSLAHGGLTQVPRFTMAGAFWGGMFRVLHDLQRSSLYGLDNLSKSSPSPASQILSPAARAV